MSIVRRGDFEDEYRSCTEDKSGRTGSRVLVVSMNNQILEQFSGSRREVAALEVRV